MMLFHASVSLELLALVAGASLYVWSMRNQGAGTLIARAIGFLVTIVAIIGIVCSAYCMRHCSDSMTMCPDKDKAPVAAVEMKKDGRTKS